VIDSHFHIRVEDSSDPGERAVFAEWMREEMDALGIDKLCLMAYPENVRTWDRRAEGTPVVGAGAMRRHNAEAVSYVEEYPDLFHAWAVIDPRAEDAAGLFREAIHDRTGVIGLKHHSIWFEQPVSDPALHPLAEVAVEHDLPLIAHVTNPLEERYEEVPYETTAHYVAELAASFPDLKIVSAHIGAGGDWEYRPPVIADHENVYLDLSGTNCDAGQVETAAEVLGTDRLVFGSDTWLVPDVGKLAGADLTPEERATIAYKMEALLPEDHPTRYSPAELDERRAAAAERFAALDEPEPDRIVDANAFLGDWAFRPVDGDPEALLDRMDRAGVDRAVVSSTEAVTYRNPHNGNRELREAVAGHEDRFLPLATVDPTYSNWREALAECDEWGFRGVKLLPTYHDYDPDDPAAVELLEECARRELPVVLAATLEDQRGRHPRMRLRGDEGIRRDFWADDHVDAIVDLLKDAPDADVVLADCWTHAARIKRELTPRKEGLWYRNEAREGRLLFVLDDLFMYYTSQGAEIVEEIGVDHLVFGPQLPFKYFRSYYNYVEHLPVEEDDRDRVRAGNALALFAPDGVERRRRGVEDD
jgi:predicted TIM-barrel fold metal-dependent hydrolase